MIAMKYTALVTIAAVVYTFILSGLVGAARAKTGVNAPAIAGQPDFDKAFRIHMNTVEQLVLFIPVLWLATSVVGDLWAAEIGVVWVVGRVGVPQRCEETRTGLYHYGVADRSPDGRCAVGDRSGLHGLAITTGG